MRTRIIESLPLAIACLVLGPAACKSDNMSHSAHAGDRRSEARNDDQQTPAGEQVQADRGDDADTKHERFELIDRESREEFSRRADQRITGIEREIQGVTPRVTASSNTEAREELDKARKAIDEARRDLDEVRNKTGDIVDDGRMGVTVAINRAQRAIDDVKEDLGESRE